MKKFFLGLLIGIFVTAVIPVGAAVEEYICKKAQYKVIINGEEFSHPELPILNYKGNTYAPFRPMLEAAGLVVEWNGDLGQAEVTTPSKDDTIKEDNVKEGEDEHMGIKPVVINDKKYFWTHHIHTYLGDSDYTFWHNSDNDTLQFVKKNEFIPGIEPEIIIDNIPIIRFPDIPRISNYAYLEWEYFVNTLLPIISEE